MLNNSVNHIGSKRADASKRRLWNFSKKLGLNVNCVFSYYKYSSACNNLTFQNAKKRQVMAGSSSYARQVMAGGTVITLNQGWATGLNKASYSEMRAFFI